MCLLGALPLRELGLGGVVEPRVVDREGGSPRELLREPQVGLVVASVGFGDAEREHPERGAARDEGHAHVPANVQLP